MEASERISRMPESERKPAWEKFNAIHPLMRTRILLGRIEDKSSVLQLKDGEGRNRLVLKVASDGSPFIQFLDAQGNVGKELRLTP
jgi:hypothetical protein